MRQCYVLVPILASIRTVNGVRAALCVCVGAVMPHTCVARSGFTFGTYVLVRRYSQPQPPNVCVWRIHNAYNTYLSIDWLCVCLWMRCLHVMCLHVSACSAAVFLNCNISLCTQSKILTSLSLYRRCTKSDVVRSTNPFQVIFGIFSCVTFMTIGLKYLWQFNTI